MPKSNVDLLTQAEYARWRGERGLSGSSREAVRRAVDEQRITTHGPDRLIDPASADVEWARNTRARLSPQATGSTSATQAGVGNAPGVGTGVGAMPPPAATRGREGESMAGLFTAGADAGAGSVNVSAPGAPANSDPVAAAAMAPAVDPGGDGAPSHQGGPTAPAPAIGAEPAGAAGSSSAQPAQAEEDSYARSRARREKADADMAEMESAKLRNILVVREDVDRAVFEVARELRDALESGVNALAAELASLDNADLIAKRLRTHHRASQDLLVSVLREKAGPHAAAAARQVPAITADA